MLAPMNASAQVTIGSGNLPSKVSLLDLDASDIPKALHLPRVSDIGRNTLVNPASEQGNKDLAVGLLVFNTDNSCLEYWNGVAWISLCDGDIPDPCGGFGTMDIVFCSGSTVADLTQRAHEAGGNGNVQWFDAASDGTALDPSTPLIAAKYWADNCAGEANRVPVMIYLASCFPIDNSGRVTGWANVMYDFQTQTLEAFVTTGEEASAWQWQASTDNINFINITGATSKTFTIPPYFVYGTYGGMVRGTDGQTANSVDFNMREMYFRCALTTSTRTTNSASFKVEVIRTNTAGYGRDITASGDTVYYLTIQRGLNGVVRGGTIKMALFNLGSSRTDSVGLGNFYQWGRVADGHERTVWKKQVSPTTINDGLAGTPAFSYMAAWLGLRSTWGTPTTTSTTIPTGTPANYTDATTGQVLATQPDYYGVFITHSGNWGRPIVDLWGANNSSPVNNPPRADAPTNLAGWSVRAQGNNPCPDGWYIPSAWDFWDIYQGTGTDTPAMPRSGSYAAATNNYWRWRPQDDFTGTFGGALIINPDDEIVFLPAMGWRGSTTGALGNTGSSGSYWSSTNNGGTNAYNLQINSSVVNTAANYGRTTGMAIRCIKE